MTTGVGCLLVRLQILVWDYGHKFWFGIVVRNFGLELWSQILDWDHYSRVTNFGRIGVTNFPFSGAARHVARRSSKKRVFSPRLSPMVAHGVKEECRTDSPFSLTLYSR